MWFKQAQLFQLTDSFTFQPQALAEKLDTLAFRPCLPSHFSSMGWVSPIEEEGEPLVATLNGYMMICLQFEEKILPATVIRQELRNKVKERETAEGQKLRRSEKNTLKDEITTMLLTRAFTRLTRYYAYIDPKNNSLILGTNNAKKTEQFISMFCKSLGSVIHAVEVKDLSPLLTLWLKNQNYPSSFAIEKSCVLQDPNQQNRVVRCTQQDLFAAGIQALVKDGCQVKQIALSWHDNVHFILADNSALSAIKFQDALLAQAQDMEAETSQQKFNADFFIMSETLSALLKDLHIALTMPSKLAVA